MSKLNKFRVLLSYFLIFSSNAHLSAQTPPNPFLGEAAGGVWLGEDDMLWNMDKNCFDFGSFASNIADAQDLAIGGGGDGAKKSNSNFYPLLPLYCKFIDEATKRGVEVVGPVHGEVGNCYVYEVDDGGRCELISPRANCVIVCNNKTI